MDLALHTSKRKDDLTICLLKVFLEFKFKVALWSLKGGSYPLHLWASIAFVGIVASTVFIDVVASSVVDDIVSFCVIVDVVASIVFCVPFCGVEVE